MTPHISGSSLSAQARYAAGTREILESYFAEKPIRTEYLIVDKGKLAGPGAHSYSAGDATKGSEEAARYKKARLSAEPAHDLRCSPCVGRDRTQAAMIRAEVGGRGAHALGGASSNARP